MMGLTIKSREEGAYPEALNQKVANCERMDERIECDERVGWQEALKSPEGPLDGN